MSKAKPPINLQEISLKEGQEVMDFPCAYALKVLGEQQADFDAFVVGIVRAHHIHVALLKEKSPSCGSHSIYDGTFTSRLIKGKGVTAAILEENNVYVFSESKIQSFEIFVKQNFLDKKK